MSDVLAVETIRRMNVESSVTIQAPRPRVYEVMINEVDRWWVKPYRMAEDSDALILEPKVGGRLYEPWGEGEEGGLWAIITGLRRNEWIELTGKIGMRGAVFGIVWIELEERGDSTLVRLYHQAFGDLQPEAEKNYTEGWKFLLGSLKESVEGS